MKRILLSIAALIALGSAPAFAQTTNCKVSTSAPTYASGVVAPLSCETDGDLRVNASGGGGGGGGTSSTFGATFPTDGTAIGALDTSGDMAPLTLDASGALVVTGGGGGGGSVDITAVGGNTVTTTVPVSGTVTVSGTVAATQSGTWTVQPGDTANTTPWLVTTVPSATAGDTLSHSAVLAATTNATSVKASAGTVFNIAVSNNSANIAYLKLYNSASAPTCGSGTPVARHIIPASTAGAGSNINISVGQEFTTGIAYCVTSGIADSDTAAVAASAYLINIVYK